MLHANDSPSDEEPSARARRRKLRELGMKKKKRDDEEDFALPIPQIHDEFTENS